MSYHRGQIEEFITKTLFEMAQVTDIGGFLSRDAVYQLLGTLAVESDFGKFLWQKGGGPARGPMQIEPETFVWLQGKYRKWLPNEYKLIPFQACMYDLRLSIWISRFRYWVDSKPIPHWEDVKGLARYWKRVYNASDHPGATEEKFIRKFNLYVLGK